VKAKDQMIGIRVFFPDIHQPNEDYKDWEKEKCGKR
jgi:hypothetical protein